MTAFNHLEVWGKAHQLTLDAHRITYAFEDRDLAQHIRRVAASIPVNLAVGCGRGSDAALHTYLQKALDAGYEIAYLMLLAYDLGYLESTHYAAFEMQLVELEVCLEVMIDRVKPESAALPLPTGWGSLSEGKRGLGSVSNSHRWLFTEN